MTNEWLCRLNIAQMKCKIYDEAELNENINFFIK